MTDQVIGPFGTLLFLYNKQYAKCWSGPLLDIEHSGLGGILLQQMPYISIDSVSAYRQRLILAGLVYLHAPDLEDPSDKSQMFHRATMSCLHKCQDSVYFTCKFICHRWQSIRFTRKCYLSKRIQMNNKLKADRPHPRNCPQTPTDYRHTYTLDWWWGCSSFLSSRESETEGRADRQTDATSALYPGFAMLHGR